jgi:LmbE family N-acetylglucosaminyl deacetylase
MHWIYLSPHFDDAVLSCGGLIWQQAQARTPVEIWTIFAADPPPGPISEFAKENHALWGVASGREIVAQRRDEDRKAARLVGANLVHFDFTDCIYRRSSEGNYLYTKSVFDPPHPSDQKLLTRIARALKARLHAGDVVVCPLTLGGHVDHVLVRRAAESLDRPLHYYADVPYILKYPQTLEMAISRLQAETFTVSETGFQAWLKGVRAYKSQLSSLYDNQEVLEGSLRDYWESRRGIRLWRVG